MRKIVQVIFFVLLSACASNVVSFYVVDEQKIDFSTFSFYERKTNNLSSEQLKIDSLIEQNISIILVNTGFNNRSKSDIYISYSITLGATSSSSVENNRYNNYNYSPYQNVNTTHYKEGVMLIEIFNKQDKLLWQGSKSFKVRKSIDTKELLIQYAKEITSSFKSNL